jgi:thiosulfate/3-mercaptopyruvate sulfurtransferase
MTSPIVSTAWLAEHLADPRVVVVDGSWYLASSGRNPRAEYLAAHIPGAIFWDIDAMSRVSSLPHMLPDPDVAARQIGQLGIGNADMVVVYDGSGFNFSAARVWWELRYFGHDRVAVLDGGLVLWRKEGRPVEPGTVHRPAMVFEVRPRPALLRDLEQVRDASANRTATLVDARSPGRFEGTEPEPRPGIRSGHVPGARNVPLQQLVDASGRLLSPEELRRLFRAAGLPPSGPVIASCGSGVSGCAVALGLAVAGVSDVAIYDGSWTEWGGRQDTPVVTGPADPVA